MKNELGILSFILISNLIPGEEGNDHEKRETGVKLHDEALQELIINPLEAN